MCKARDKLLAQIDSLREEMSLNNEFFAGQLRDAKNEVMSLKAENSLLKQKIRNKGLH